MSLMGCIMDEEPEIKYKSQQDAFQCFLVLLRLMADECQQVEELFEMEIKEKCSNCIGSEFTTIPTFMGQPKRCSECGGTKQYQVRQ